MTTQLLTYKEIRQRMQRHPIRQSEVPIEHEVSLPVPTLRCGQPAFGFFACSASRRPGQPTRLSPPDRWWAFRAQGGQLLGYNLSAVVPFAASPAWTDVEVPAPSPTVAGVRQLLADIEAMHEALAPEFFAGNAGDAESRAALVKMLRQFAPDPLLQQYRAMAPDFFAWLEK